MQPDGDLIRTNGNREVTAINYFHRTQGGIMIRLQVIVHSCFAALLCLIISSDSLFADAQGAPTAPAPASSYSLGDVLMLSALGGTVPSFTPLSIWNWTDGWLQPWIPPPNGELHLQRGGWVNTDSAFFSRELDPTFSFNAGTSSTRDEYIGAVSLFVPLNRRADRPHHTVH
jgi:hypothetical protein